MMDWINSKLTELQLECCANPREGKSGREDFARFSRGRDTGRRGYAPLYEEYHKAAEPVPEREPPLKDDWASQVKEVFNSALLRLNLEEEEGDLPIHDSDPRKTGDINDYDSKTQASELRPQRSYSGPEALQGRAGSEGVFVPELQRVKQESGFVKSASIDTPRASSSLDKQAQEKMAQARSSKQFNNKRRPSIEVDETLAIPGASALPGVSSQQFSRKRRPSMEVDETLAVPGVGLSVKREVEVQGPEHGNPELELDPRIWGVQFGAKTRQKYSSQNAQETGEGPPNEADKTLAADSAALSPSPKGPHPSPALARTPSGVTPASPTSLRSPRRTESFARKPASSASSPMVSPRQPIRQVEDFHAKLDQAKQARAQEALLQRVQSTSREHAALTRSQSVKTHQNANHYSVKSTKGKGTSEVSKHNRGQKAHAPNCHCTECRDARKSMLKKMHADEREAQLAAAGMDDL